MAPQLEISSTVIPSALSFSAEIVELFLENCREDCATLISSSLVCKNWVPATRRYLFSNVTISVGRGVGLFGDLFHHPHATITPFVKSLSLIAEGAQCRTDTEQRFLVQLLSKLGVVRFHSFSLEFKQERGPRAKTFLLSAFALGSISSYHTVVNLSLLCSFYTISDLVELVCSLPLLEVADLAPQIHDTSIHPQLRPSSTLRKMTLGRQLQPILDWISDITPDHSISDISLNYRPDFHRSADISRFLTSQGNKLIQLTLNSTYKWRPWDVERKYIDISANGGLRRLELNSLSSGNVEGILNNVSAPSPAEITITIGSYTDTSGDLAGKLDLMLSEARYDHLKSLTLKGASWSFENSFSRCKSRGILHQGASSTPEGQGNAPDFPPHPFLPVPLPQFPPFSQDFPHPQGEYEPSNSEVAGHTME